MYHSDNLAQIMKTAYLRLKDGTEFRAKAFGAPIALEAGEVVFNTGIPGYQEILTDPSYSGQIVVLTSPMIGNYGISDEDDQSSGVKATALIIRKLYRGKTPEGRKSLDDYLKESGIPALEDLDTRALAIHLRDHGSQNGIIFEEKDRQKAIEKLDVFPEITERDLIDGVSVKNRMHNPTLGKGFAEPPHNGIRKFAVVDYGIKRSIINELYRRGAEVTLFPHTATADEILASKPDALFLSNGPGDPALLADAVKLARSCIGRIPVQGICLGHQIITLALGGKTVKMKFGHHGSNHPVRDNLTGRTFVTAQNHGFVADPASLKDGAEIWMTNANDGSVEGIRNEKLNVRSVQFHPEAAPGPEDAQFIFDIFMEKAE